MSTTKIKIGRSPDCNVVIDERWDTVSNDHADIELRNGALVYIDHSSNGTIINKQKIHNREVGIYPGDNIMLAGVYELKWDLISEYFPQSKRPTVTKNIRAEQNEDVSRKTAQVSASISTNSKNTRKTEQFNAPQQRQHSFVQTGNQTIGHETNNYGKENAYSQAEIDSMLEKWNWGGFLSTWMWAIANRIFWPLLIIPVVFIPYLGQIALLVLSVYLGLYGSKMAWAKGKYSDFSAFVSSQKKWTFIGILVFISGLAVNAIIVYYLLQLL